MKIKMEHFGCQLQIYHLRYSVFLSHVNRKVSNWLIIDKMRQHNRRLCPIVAGASCSAAVALG